MRPLAALPFCFTVFRLVLGPAFLYAHAREMHWALAVIIGLAILTDWLDGFLARRLDAVSVAGKLLDPFADALFCMIVFVDFAVRGLMPVWIVVLLVAREALVTFLLRPLALQRGVVIAARPLGKLKTGFQFAVMVTVVVSLAPTAPFASLLRVLAAIGFYLVLALSLGSAAFYASDLSRAFRSDRRPQEEGQARE